MAGFTMDYLKYHSFLHKARSLSEGRRPGELGPQQLERWEAGARGWLLGAALHVVDGLGLPRGARHSVEDMLKKVQGHPSWRLERKEKEVWKGGVGASFSSTTAPSSRKIRKTCT